MKKMKCKKCNGKDIKVSVNINLEIDSKNYRNMNKKVVASKSTKIRSANWENVTFICKKCGHCWWKVEE